ncbi:MAG: leucyl/phenylalanyl-tRNA--protein transferase [Rhodothermales bacterium]|nr:leucyl/phenylalanyl-tRNA--protein transferase [Rhodothermales bacterium]
MMINAYASGYFPMAEPDEDGQIYWYLPEVRALLPIDSLHIPRSLAKVIRQGRFQLFRNRDFDAIIRHCADRDETWLSPELVEVFMRLHREGWAHSVGAWQGDRLVGGVYGLALGRAFFAESMFHLETDASKVALVGLVDWLRSQEFELLDIQFMTEHLRRFGAFEITADAYQERLDHALLAFD